MEIPSYIRPTKQQKQRNIWNNIQQIENALWNIYFLFDIRVQTSNSNFNLQDLQIELREENWAFIKKTSLCSFNKSHDFSKT